MIGGKTIFLSLFLLVPFILSAPSSWGRGHGRKHWPKRRDHSKFYQKREDTDAAKAIISKFHIDTNIQFRYAKTVVTSQMKNPGSKPVKADFFMIIPDSAFISNLSMIIDGQEFVSEVKRADEAAEEFDKAVTDGWNSAIVSKPSQSRNTNRFNVDANIKAGDKVVFKLTYEEKLERKDGQYEYGVVIDPRAVIDDFKVEININESLPLTKLFVPELLESNAIDFVKGEQENSVAVVTRDVDQSPNNAKVVFQPDKEYQELAGDQGMAGKLVVRYDVDRSNQENEVQVIDGYFVHYLVPENLKTLPKHVVFVLDVSGSMSGKKLEQMKDAIFTVLDDMTDEDYFNIITFSSGVDIWDQDNETSVIQATEDNKAEAIGRVLELNADGGTNINDAVLNALDVGKSAAEYLPKDVKSMIVFLTDGQATEGVENPRQIQDNIKSANSELGIPIFTIAFGADADFVLVEKIASANQGAARRIYDGSDAALQLENFYAEISSPLLTNLKLSYVGGLEDSSQVETKTVFKGKELMVVGKLSKDATDDMTIVIDAEGKDGSYRKEITLCPRTTSDSSLVADTIITCHRPIEYPKSEAQQFLQHLYAFVNIKQIMEKIEKSANKTEASALKQRAINLALKNNFVTDLTSLVVVKPDEDPIINALVTEVLSEDEVPSPEFSAGPHSYSSYLGSSYSMPSNVQYSLSGGPRISSGSRIASSSFGIRKSKPQNSVPRTVSKSAKRPQPKRTTTYRTTTTQVPVMDQTCNGNITFYTKTYLRGESFNVDDDLEDMDNFNNKAVTAVIEGDCCWKIFSEKRFKGHEKILFPNVDYNGVSSFGSHLFRAVSSVKKTIC